MKSVITALLAVFVAGSVVYMFVKEARSRQAVSRAETAGTQATPATPAPVELPAKVVLYYFHGSARCARCISFETYSQETVLESFATELGKGRLEWKVFNVDQPANEHFVGEFQLTAKSLVVARYVGGRRTDWANLEDIWNLYSDKGAFKKYVRENVKQYLEK